MNIAPQNDDLRATWFGQVSPDWRLARAKNAFRVVSKKVGDRSAEYDLLSLTLRGIIPRDLDSGKGKFPESFDTYQEVKKGDIVFCLFDIDETPRTVGLSAMDGMVTGAYTVVRCTKLADPRYVTYFYLSIDDRKGLRPFYTGLRKVVRTETFLNAAFPVPDLATQRAIADFLDRETERIDLLIEKKQRLVALLGEKARSVINQATTIGFREGVTQDSGEKWLGEVASHWRVTPLKWFTRLQSGFAFKAERFGDIGTRLVRMNNLKRGALDLEEAVCIADEDVNMSVMLCAGDILLGMSGSIGETGSLGNFAVVTEEDLPCLLNQRVGRFQFVGDELLPDYLKLVIQSASFLDPIFLAATSTAQFNISPSQVGATMFALPPITEQKEIIQEVATRNVGFTQARERTLVSIERLKELRSALITAAVTGQIDLSTYAKSGATDRHLDAIQEEMGA